MASAAGPRSECWLWTGPYNKKGYGTTHVKVGGVWKTKSVHRLSYELAVGQIPKGSTIDHLCGVRHCVNPAHLEAVSLQENIKRGSRATKTHCKRGHLLSGDNLKVRPGPRRLCLTCYRAWLQSRRKETQLALC